MTQPRKVEILLSSLNACVVTSSRVVDGKAQGLTMAQKVLVEFLISRAKSLVVVQQPFPDDPDVNPIMESYFHGKLVETTRFLLPRPLATAKRRGTLPFYFLTKIVDLVSSFILIVRTKKRFNLFIGVESINALVGLSLRKAGRVERVVYYVFDYLPDRFHNRFANLIFLWLDRYALQHSDLGWNVYKKIAGMRSKVWGKEFKAKQIVAPALSPPPDRTNFRDRTDHLVAYIGGLDRSQGVQIVISAMSRVAKKVPDAELHIIGKGSYESTITKLVEELNLRDRVMFHGFLPDADAASVLRKCRVGVAAYTEETFRFQSRHPVESSKARYYLHFGLPIIFSTAIPWLAELVKKFNAGLTVNPDADSVAEAITKLMLDDELYHRALKGTYLMNDAFNSERYYPRVFSRTLKSLGYPVID